MHDRMTRPICYSEFLPDYQVELMAHIQSLTFVAGDPQETLKILQEMGSRWMHTFYPEKQAILKVWGWQK